MIQINVSQLLKGPIGSMRNIEVDGIVDVISGTGSRVWGEITLTRTDRGVLTKGKLRTDLTSTCSRCLSLFERNLAFDIEEVYLPVIDILTGRPISLPGETDSLTIDEHHDLDLTEAIRQYALLEIPMKPLCRPDCAGLSLGCEDNHNLDACEHPPQKTDSHRSKLKKMVVSGSLLPNEPEGKG